MTHLTFEEMLSFVSCENPEGEELKISEKVNCHIRVCRECREKTAALYQVHEELMRIRILPAALKKIYREKADDTYRETAEDEILMQQYRQEEEQYEEKG